MATDVDARVSELVDAGLVPRHATYRTLQSGLDYDEANESEALHRIACGDHCQGHGGGGYVDGDVWSVYRIDWTVKRKRGLAG